MNDKIKALWMAQYLGQHVVEASFLNEIFTLSGVTLSELNINSKEFITINKNSLILSGDFSGIGNEGTSQADISECHLLLRTVDMLTDEECDTFYANFGERNILRTFVNDFEDYIKGNNWHPSDCLMICQYLLRIGILLPFTYLNKFNQPVTLSPDEIISLGWAQIKTS